jgi:hypothetical protein
MSTKNIYIYIELPIIGEVEFYAPESAFYITNDGIGEYEIHGRIGYDYGTSYIEVDEIHWDRDKYTIFDNKNIENYVNANEGGDNCPYKKLALEADYLFDF